MDLLHIVAMSHDADRIHGGDLAEDFLKLGQIHDEHGSDAKAGYPVLRDCRNSFVTRLGALGTLPLGVNGAAPERCRPFR